MSWVKALRGQMAAGVGVDVVDGGVTVVRGVRVRLRRVLRLRLARSLLLRLRGLRIRLNRRSTADTTWGRVLLKLRLRLLRSLSVRRVRAGMTVAGVVDAIVAGIVGVGIAGGSRLLRVYRVGLRLH